MEALVRAQSFSSFLEYAGWMPDDDQFLVGGASTETSLAAVDRAHRGSYCFILIDPVQHPRLAQAVLDVELEPGSQRAALWFLPIARSFRLPRAVDVDDIWSPTKDQLATNLIDEFLELSLPDESVALPGIVVSPRLIGSRESLFIHLDGEDGAERLAMAVRVLHEAAAGDSAGPILLTSIGSLLDQAELRYTTSTRSESERAIERLVEGLHRMTGHLGLLS